MPTKKTPLKKEKRNMHPQYLIVKSIKAKIIGKKKKAYSRYFHNFPYKVDFFEIISEKNSKKICIGFMSPENKDNDANIIIFHSSIQTLKNKVKLKKWEKRHPEVIITFRLKKDGLMQALMGGEGSRRINIAKFDPGFQKLAFDLITQISMSVRSYNLNHIKNIRGKINKERK